MRITTIINQKGGVGKTTTAHALVTGLRKKGFFPLAIDADPQGNLSYTMNADTSSLGLYEVMRGDAKINDLIQKLPQGDILPSTLMLAAADMEFIGKGREWIVNNMIESLQDKYSHVIIDSPPTLGILTVNALTASNDVIIPMGADIYSLQGLYQLCNTIDKVRKFCEKNIQISGVLLTRYNGRSILSRDLREGIASNASDLDVPIFKTYIREGVAVKEAQTQQTSLYDYAPKSKPAQDYLDFVKEYLLQQ